MDIMAQVKEKVNEIVDKIKNDKDFAAKFRKDPVATVESLLGIDLPNEQIANVVEMVKAKIDMEKIGDALGNLKGLFNK
jgi:uncharacterized protein YpuA (DUF1002 family)